VPVLGAVELRQYTLHPGQRDALIRLFDRELVGPQEAAGMRVVGQFRDLDDPDRFVWLRGFPDLAARPAALSAFYGGPVWARHRGAANATMVDSDDVLLLRPVPGAPAFPDAPGSPGDRPERTGIAVSVYPLTRPPTAEHLELFRSELCRGAIALLQTEPEPNNFPALPVREGEQVIVRVARSPRAAGPELLSLLEEEPRELRLQPTDRSALR
jgi:hypothetical protein